MARGDYAEPPGFLGGQDSRAWAPRSVLCERAPNEVSEKEALLQEPRQRGDAACTAPGESSRVIKCRQPLGVSGVCM